jgi:uncharacterized protein
MNRPWLPFVLPIALFLILTTLEGRFGKSLYPVLYAVKAVLVAGVLTATARHWRPLLHWEAKPVLIGVLSGVVGLAVWLALDRITPPLTFLGKREAFDPSTLGIWQAPFLGVRFIGLALLVPVLEELFWRGFLLRWITEMEGWEKLPVEKFTPVAALIVSALFAIAHPEWLAALVYGLGLCWLLKVTKSLTACIMAHAVTNLLLGIYVLVTKNWQLW